ncbi:protein-L-isoaspartate(D-aspartate) O-methyltransferase [Edaphocola aurantiacus]|uniref:protein-L-isoaspartate(D-aspartate) O-methyltransferase n=1 Tax=Edaphocola aurantiacus TaxID=2601682 RepID=UPI001C9380F1|nr:protein-L-isoaspartate(D-aspartate) O-methyltransferase [Edaphocola aurantiacus]
MHHLPTEDTYLHKGLRKKLVEELRNLGIIDEGVLSAINTVPRHFFLDSALERYAYENRAFPIAAGQTISHPFTVALQTQVLDIKPFEKVLEVGTGSGYQAAVLAMLKAKVFSIERQQELFKQMNRFDYIKNLTNIKRFYGDGFEGLPSYAPFDKVIVTAAAPYVPEKLIQQLKVGGIMVIPVGDEEQHMKRIVKTDTGYTEDVIGKAYFVPMLSGKQKH